MDSSLVCQLLLVCRDKAKKKKTMEHTCGNPCRRGKHVNNFTAVLEVIGGRELRLPPGRVWEHVYWEREEGGEA